MAMLMMVLDDTPHFLLRLLRARLRAHLPGLRRPNHVGRDLRVSERTGDGYSWPGYILIPPANRATDPCMRIQFNSEYSPDLSSNHGAGQAARSATTFTKYKTNAFPRSRL